MLESKDAVDYTALKQELDEQTERLWGIISSGIYVVKQSYKDYQFTVRTREDRGLAELNYPWLSQRNRWTVKLKCGFDRNEGKKINKGKQEA